VLAGDFNLPPQDIWSSKESQGAGISTGLDNFHFDDTTPPYGHYSVGSDGSTAEPFSPYNCYHNNNGGSTGSESMMDFQGMNNQVPSQQMTPMSSNSSVMMASLPADTQQNNKGLPQTRTCLGCCHHIHGPYVSTSTGVDWHSACLKCTACGCHLGDMRTCFMRDNKPYCKNDYFHLFAPKCANCKLGLVKGELMMSIREKKYHVQCFRCYACHNQLIPGDSFVCNDDGSIYCMRDYERLFSQHNGSEDSRIIDAYTGIPGSNGIGTNGRMNGKGHVTGSDRGKDSGHGKRRPGKTTRQRTVLNEKQLTVLHTFYDNNCRPDAIMKEQLTTMTGLPQRVIRVWFQNKRCKDKKRSIALKQQQEQHQKLEQMRNDSGGQTNGQQNSGQQKQQKEPPSTNDGANTDQTQGSGHTSNQSVTSNSNGSQQHMDSSRGYTNHHLGQQQPAWKALSDFALQSEIEKPPFQQLVSNFSDQAPSSMSDCSEICSISSVSSHSYNSCSTTPHLNHDSSSTTMCS